MNHDLSPADAERFLQAYDAAKSLYTDQEWKSLDPGVRKCALIFEIYHIHGKEVPADTMIAHETLPKTFDRAQALPAQPAGHDGWMHRDGLGLGLDEEEDRQWTVAAATGRTGGDSDLDSAVGVALWGVAAMLLWVVTASLLIL